MTVTKTPVRDRVWSKIDAHGPGGCWLWTGTRNSSGYGAVCMRDGARCYRVPAHRTMYELLVGPIPDGLQLDHLCRVRHCVNPAHLEPVTQRENLRRGVGWAGVNAVKTHCPQGHPYTPDNTYVCPKGKRQCRICRREAMARYEARTMRRAS